MIPELGKYAIPVLVAWGGTLAMLAGIVGLSLWHGARVKRALAEAEARLAGARKGQANG